jgi:hypothetical protein
MSRWVWIGACLALSACGTVPGSGAESGRVPTPMTVEHLPPAGAVQRSSDAPSTRSIPSFRLPSMRRGWAPSDERPSWLPALPDEIERYPVPHEWHSDTLAFFQRAE